jgi:hypothetical protein
VCVYIYIYCVCVCMCVCVCVCMYTYMYCVCVRARACMCQQSTLRRRSVCFWICFFASGVCVCVCVCITHTPAVIAAEEQRVLLEHLLLRSRRIPSRAPSRTLSSSSAILFWRERHTNLAPPYIKSRRCHGLSRTVCQLEFNEPEPARIRFNEIV